MTFRPSGINYAIHASTANPGGGHRSPQHTTYANLEATWRAVEEAGADSPSSGTTYPLFGPRGHPLRRLDLLAAMAAVTERVQIGTLSPRRFRTPTSPPTWPAPSITFPAAATSRASAPAGGRDYVEYGYDFKTAPERVKDRGRPACHRGPSRPAQPRSGARTLPILMAAPANA